MEVWAPAGWVNLFVEAVRGTEALGAGFRRPCRYLCNCCSCAGLLVCLDPKKQISCCVVLCPRN